MNSLRLLVNNCRLLQWTYPIFTLNCNIQAKRPLIQEISLSPLSRENA